ncbi:MAG: hypothetical protein ACK5AZ_05110 [Bryobacteraceae bacterium]
MTPDELDQILASAENVQPSPAFSKRVMAEVHREAAEPPRLPFPWLRFGIGATAAGVMGAAGTVLVAESGLDFAQAAAPVLAIAPELSLAFAAALIGLGAAAIPHLLSRA